VSAPVEVFSDCRKLSRSKPPAAANAGGSIAPRKLKVTSSPGTRRHTLRGDEVIDVEAAESVRAVRCDIEDQVPAAGSEGVVDHDPTRRIAGAEGAVEGQVAVDDAVVAAEVAVGANLDQRGIDRAVVDDQLAGAAVSSFEPAMRPTKIEPSPTLTELPSLTRSRLLPSPASPTTVTARSARRAARH
jgi:hypothetical protein